jgi:hypothetical protein
MVHLQSFPTGESGQDANSTFFIRSGVEACDAVTNRRRAIDINWWQLRRSDQILETMKAMTQKSTKPELARPAAVSVMKASTVAPTVTSDAAIRISFRAATCSNSFEGGW